MQPRYAVWNAHDCVRPLQAQTFEEACREAGADEYGQVHYEDGRLWSWVGRAPAWIDPRGGWQRG